MTPRIPTDHQVRMVANTQPEGTTASLLALAELARRAAESFAAGDVVSTGADGRHGLYVGPSPTSPHCSVISIDGIYVGYITSCLTLVPPAPTAIEVFAAAYDTVGGRDIGPERVAGFAAFREFCRVAGIDSDEPLATGGAL